MEQKQGGGHGEVRQRTVDLVVAVIVFALGALVAYDSNRLGASWGEDGPQAGYFPFYVGLLVCISSIVIFAQSLLPAARAAKVFVTAGQLRQVLIILVPSAVYVLGVQLIGIYVSSAVFIALFMVFVGSYGVLRSVVVGLTVSASAFLLFEIWFKIPLPKGPLESLLGY